MIVAKRAIPAFRLEFDAAFRHEFGQRCAAVLQSDALSEGSNVRAFEKSFSQFIGARHCIATSNGTTALEIALRAVGVTGKEVIVPTNTFIATAIAAERAGGKVKLLDIEPDTYALSPEKLERAITPNTGAVALVHIGGIISRSVEKIVEICRQKGVLLVEDAAHAHGARRGDFRAGTIGQVAAFSFFPTKVMTTAEGGMVTTNDPELAARCRDLKDFGRVDGGLLSHGPGLNAHMTEFQGILGCMELDRTEERIILRRILAEHYMAGLRGTEYIRQEDSGEASGYKLVLRCEKDSLAIGGFCALAGAPLAGEVYRFPLHEQPVYQGRFNPKDFPVANAFCGHHICPPLYPEMELDDVRYVCDVLKAAEKAI